MLYNSGQLILFFVLFFEKGFLHIAPAILNITLWTQLASNSETCLLLPHRPLKLKACITTASLLHVYPRSAWDTHDPLPLLSSANPTGDLGALGCRQWNLRTRLDSTFLRLQSNHKPTAHYSMLASLLHPLPSGREDGCYSFYYSSAFHSPISWSQNCPNAGIHQGSVKRSDCLSKLPK